LQSFTAVAALNEGFRVPPGGRGKGHAHRRDPFGLPLALPLNRRDELVDAAGSGPQPVA
jgi:hypothetical protein